MNIVIVGSGGHSKVVQDIVTCYPGDKIIGYLDDKYKEASIQDQIYFGPVESVRNVLRYFPNTQVIIAIGDNRTRKQMVERLNLSHQYYAAVIHPSAVISSRARIGSGTVVMAGAVIQSDSVIGEHAIINTSAIIEHDNIIGDYAHVSPNAALTGAVALGQGVHIGAGATVNPKIVIGEWSTIGSGATVVRAIPSYCTAVGVPAKVLNKQTEGERIEQRVTDIETQDFPFTASYERH